MTPLLPVSLRDHDRSHDPMACCYLCAFEGEGFPFWFELRKRRGIDPAPYQRRRLGRLRRRAG